MTRRVKNNNNMKTKLKHSVRNQPAEMQKASKMPNPTNFSNSRTQFYMNSSDENHVPNNPLKLHPNANSTGFPADKTKPHSKVPMLNLQKPKGLTIPPKESPTLFYPQTSKAGSGQRLLPKSENKMVTPKAGAGLFSNRQRLEKLSPKLLPPSHDTDINITFTTLENVSKEDEEKEANRNSNQIEFQYMAKDDKPEKYLVNLEEVLEIEVKLWGVLEALRTEMEVSKHCKEWWALTDSEWILNVDKIFRDKLTRKTIRNAIIYESLAISLTDYLMCDARLSVSHITSLKNLIFYVHQNYLYFCALLCQKLPSEAAQNIWTKQLEATISTKIANDSCKGEELVSLLTNNTTILHILRHIWSIVKGYFAARKVPVSPMLNCVGNLLNQIDKCSPKQSRDLLSKAAKAVTLMKDSLLPQMGDEPLQELEALPLVKVPYLPALKEKDKLTLVLDLDETLVHYFETEEEGHILVRPGADYFLRELAQHYEIVVFTAALQDYADWVLDQIDPTKHIKYRLYRQHAVPYEKSFVKDLSRIGRDLSKIIIVDNVKDNFQLQQENGIWIKSWIDDPADTALAELCQLLKGFYSYFHKIVEVALSKPTDVRDTLARMSE